MIIVRLLGGLGNQLFQYAAGRGIASMSNSILKIDITGFDSYPLHRYSLNHFNIIENIASPSDISRLRRKRNGPVAMTMKLIDAFKPYYKRSFIEERFFHFDTNILRIYGDAYLEGYWQSEKYFAHISDMIRREVTVKEKPDNENAKMMRLIRDVESVSLHIRRGDYISNATTNQKHGTCDLNYYYKAIEMISSSIDEPYFFIFSDDLSWVKENLVINYPATFVAHNGVKKGYEDLRLMSQCKHHIIANSTFSWWGAWLCVNEGKKVFAPAKWFNDNTIDTHDLIPRSWHKI
jgi:hypothetical protein